MGGRDHPAGAFDRDLEREIDALRFTFLLMLVVLLPKSGMPGGTATMGPDIPALATADLPPIDCGLVDSLLPAARPTQVLDPHPTVPLRLTHTDWLHHRLTVSGPREPLAALRAAAAGAGVIPWQLDFVRRLSFCHMPVPNWTAA